MATAESSFVWLQQSLREELKRHEAAILSIAFQTCRTPSESSPSRSPSPRKPRRSFEVSDDVMFDLDDDGHGVSASRMALPQLPAAFKLAPNPDMSSSAVALTNGPLAQDRDALTPKAVANWIPEGEELRIGSPRLGELPPDAGHDLVRARSPAESPSRRRQGSGDGTPRSSPPSDTPSSARSPRMMNFHVPSFEEVRNARRVSQSGQLEPGQRTPCIRAFLESNFCEYGLAALILSNLATFGYDADYSVKYPNSDPPMHMRVIDLSFAICFTVELLLRLVAYGTSFCNIRNPDIAWNAIDTLLVSVSWIEEVIQNLIPTAPDVSSVRMLRLLRLVRIVRIIRVIRFLKDLRVMVLGVVGSVKPLLWALLLLLLITYIFAVIALQILSVSSADSIYYSSLWVALYYLFQCISGGIGWELVAQPLLDIHPLLGFLFCMYIAFCCFCVLNIVTGIFVERAAAMCSEDEENMLMAEVESRKKWVDEIETLFRTADKDGSGAIDLREFRDCMNDLRVQTCMKNLGIDVHRMDPKQLYNTLDFDNSGSLDISEFSAGLLQIHGQARSIDLSRMRHEHKQSSKELSKNLAKLTKICEEQAEKIAKVAARVNCQDAAEKVAKVPARDSDDYTPKPKNRAATDLSISVPDEGKFCL